MLKASETTTTALVPWEREAQDVPSILFGEAIPVIGYTRRAPQRRAKSPTRDPALQGVLALIEGLRAGKAELERLGFEGKAERLAARAERRQETRTKATAFVIYYVMAAALGYAAWAGING